MSTEDTIFVHVTYAGCGEWGGHREMMKIYQEDVDHRTMGFEEMINTKRLFLAEYWVDSVECSYRTDRKFLLHQRKQLTVAQEMQVLRFIQDFVPASLQIRHLHEVMNGNLYIVYMPVSRAKPVMLRFASIGKDVFQELRGKLFVNPSTGHD